ncbi:unnamed protein product [Arctogadus glacialis]
MSNIRVQRTFDDMFQQIGRGSDHGSAEGGGGDKPGTDESIPLENEVNLVSRGEAIPSNTFSSSSTFSPFYPFSFSPFFYSPFSFSPFSSF